MVASVLKNVITRNTICDNLVGFPKSGHICMLIYANKIIFMFLVVKQNIDVLNIHILLHSYVRS